MAANTTGLRTVIYPVDDLEAAKRVYGALWGVAPLMDEPYYVGYRVAGMDVGLDPHGSAQGRTGPTGYWHVADLRATMASLVDAGATEGDAVRDVGGGKLIASVTDPDGNVVGLLQEPAAG
jgi:predicted enzyme related to lactoylglutathione lyase